MQQKYSMYFRMKSKDIKTGDVAQYGGFPVAQACWAALTLRGMPDNQRLHELEWHFEKGDGVYKSSVEEVRQMVEYFFPEDNRYGITIEFSGDSPLNDENCLDIHGRRPNIGVHRSVVTFSNLGNYPKYLFMNKIFMIRNLNRYGESYGMFNKFRKIGVDLGTACVLGATINQYMSMDGLGNQFRGYAATMKAGSTSPEELRSMAMNNHEPHHIGPTWGGENRGYNAHGDYDGVERAMKFRERAAGVRSCSQVATGTPWSDGMSWEGLMKLVAAVTSDNSFLTAKDPSTKQFLTLEEKAPMEVGEEEALAVFQATKVAAERNEKIAEEIRFLRNFKARRLRAQKKIMGLFQGAEEVVKIDKGFLGNIPKAVKPKVPFGAPYVGKEGWKVVN